MDYGMDKKKKKRSGMMYGSEAKMDRKQANMGRSMYIKGSKVHSGSQPVYGSTVADAMPKAGAN